MSLRKLHRSFLRFLCVILPFSETVARSASAFGRKFSLQKGSFFAEGEPFFQKKTLKVRPSKSNSDKSGKFSLKGSARTCVLAADLGCWASCVPRKPGLHRKEVIQPLVLERLPCYDFTPIITPTLGHALLKGWTMDFGCSRLSWCDGRCVQDPGTYSPRHADPRLLAIPPSCRRVSACNLN